MISIIKNRKFIDTISKEFKSLPTLTKKIRSGYDYTHIVSRVEVDNLVHEDFKGIILNLSLDDTHMNHYSDRPYRNAAYSIINDLNLIQQNDR